MSLNDDEKRKAVNMAEGMAGDFDADQAAEFAEKHQDKGWYEDFVLLYRMVTARGFHLSAGTWATIAGALAYVVFPVDVIPDFIPVLGWIDDAFVLSFVIAQLKGEIERFRDWEDKYGPA